MQDAETAATRMVVKDGLRLGLLDEAERTLALGLVWGALKQQGPWDERELNGVLSGLLQDTGAFLDTDPAELRRWLVDTGWLERDGFGRAYRCLPLADQGASHQATAAFIDTLDLPAWVRTQRQAHAAAREARRSRWQAGQAE